ncbi:MAG: hypothetical protein V1886_00165 [archaeon]
MRHAKYAFEKMGLNENIKKEVNEFKESLVCSERHKKEGKVCLPAYTLLQKIEYHNFPPEKVRQMINRGISLYNRLSEAGRKKHFDRFYRFINEKLSGILYPGEEKINWECNNYNCPSYSVIRAVDNGNGFGEFLTIQLAATNVFKYKIGEIENKDIGLDRALFRWTQELITVDGKATNRAAEFRKKYSEEKKKEILSFIENHKNLPKHLVKKKLVEKIIGKI